MYLIFLIELLQTILQTTKILAREQAQKLKKAETLSELMGSYFKLHPLPLNLIRMTLISQKL